MPELLRQPLVYGLGMAYVGLSPNVVYSLTKGGGKPQPEIMVALCAASAVSANSQVMIRNNYDSENAVGIEADLAAAAISETSIDIVTDQNGG